MPLPNDRDARNALPIWDGCFSYFPDAWGEIAKVSVLGNVQHNLGATKLYFNRDVSKDHLNKVMRHCLDHEAGNVFDDGGKTRHLAKAAWRILAALQVSIEQDRLAALDARLAKGMALDLVPAVHGGLCPPAVAQYSPSIDT